MGRSRDDEDEVVAEISGRSVTVVWGSSFQQSQWGSARLTVTPTHVVEKSKFFITMRDTIIPLEDVSGVTLVTTFNPMFLPLILLCGLGLILMFLFKIRILIVHGANIAAVIGVSGNEKSARDFMDDLNAEVARAKKRLYGGGGGGGSSAPPAPSRSEPMPERVTVASKPAAAAAPLTVQCPECSKEYRIPAGSAGKKFRCQACQAVIDVPA